MVQNIRNQEKFTTESLCSLGSSQMMLQLSVSNNSLQISWKTNLIFYYLIECQGEHKAKNKSDRSHTTI